MNKETLAKNELNHKNLDKIGSRKGNAYVSARFRCAVGTIRYDWDGVYKLVDKIIMPINVCPFCQSRATFHHRIQQTGDNCDNVWDYKRSISNKGQVGVKLDLCLDCGKEFIIEMYVNHLVKKYFFIKALWNKLLKKNGIFKTKELLVWGDEFEY